MAYRIALMTMALIAATAFAEELRDMMIPAHADEEIVVESINPLHEIDAVAIEHEPDILTIADETAVRKPRPYLGVRIDPEPLPDLLIKHLRLDSGVGLRVQNVLVDSPADKAGIQQDDLIVGLNGEVVKEYPVFVEMIQKTEVDKTITLDVIHLGERKTLMATIVMSDPAHEEWKYSVEPEISYSWNPGRLFRLKPDQQKWLEIPMEKMPDIVNQDYFKKFMNEVYSFSHSTDGKSYSITIQGDPKNPDTDITVKADSVTINTTIGKIDQLPEPYRQMARKDVDNARKSSQLQKGRRQDVEILRHKVVPGPFKPDLIEPIVPHMPPAPDNKSMDKIEKQMKELQKQMEQMERNHQEMMEKLEKQLQKMQKVVPDAEPEHAVLKLSA